MKNREKFEKFLESLKGYDDSLIESIKKGFNACFENLVIQDQIEDDVSTIKSLANELTKISGHKFAIMHVDGDKYYLYIDEIPQIKGTAAEIEEKLNKIKKAV